MFKKIGTLKLDQTKKGENCLKGGVTVSGKSVAIHIYQNQQKHSEDSPDYIIYKLIFDKMT